MPISYCVSAKKASVVVESVVGNFTGHENVNLIVARGNRIEVQLVSPEGLKNVCEIPIYGQVLTMALVKCKRDKRHSLVVVTEKWHMSVLAYRDGQVITRAAGSIADQTGRAADNMFSLTIHRNGLIAIRAFEGSVKMIQWESGSDLRHFNVRFDYPNVSDFKFVDTGEDDVYRVAFIFDDDHGKHLQFSDLNMHDKEFRTHLRQSSIAADASVLIPVPSPISGVVVLGSNSVLYKSSENDSDVVPYTCSLLENTAFTCHGIVDASGERFILSDTDGRLLMLLLNVNKSPGGFSVKEMRIEYLGETSIADSINYIDNGVIFIGSRLGDSQLIRLVTPPAGGSYIVVLETYSNIGPIRDMIMVESDGQPQLVTCSGAEKDGSLRVIRNGIGIDELASVELAGVTAIFPIRVDSTSDNYVIVSLSEETHVLQITGEELEDVQLLEMDTTLPTMFAGTLFGPNDSGILLQVTEKQVRLMSSAGLSKFWEPTNKEAISKVSVNAVNGQVVVAARDYVYFLSCVVEEMGGLDICVSAQKQFQDEIACLDISNEGDDQTKPTTFLVLAFWRTFSMEIVQLPDLKSICQTDLPSKIVPRSIVATCIEDVHYLLIAFGDGALIYYVFDIKSGTHGEAKKSSVGTRPPSLHRVRNKNSQHLFVCSDRPVIIFSSSKKLVFSNVNVKVVNTVCSLSSSAYRDCLVISDGAAMVFGTVDDIQKIHVRSIPMGESVVRIAHQKSTGTYGVCSARVESKEDRVYASKNAAAFSKSGPKLTATRNDMVDIRPRETGSFMVLDQNTFQVLHSHEFGPYEAALSCISGQLGKDPNTYYIVGTGLIYPDETETKNGRIVIFEVDNLDRTKLRLVSDIGIRGGPLAIRILNGKLVAGINSTVRMFEWTEKELRLECSSFNHLVALDLKVLNEEVAVADIMRSVSLLSYRMLEGNFEEVAKDWNSEWMVTCEFITAESILGGEAHLNLFTVEVDKTRPITDDGRYVLEPTGFFYLGELPKVMVRSSLVAQLDDVSIEYTQPITFGTNQGTIGMVVQIDDKWKKFLTAIEKAVADSIKNCMHIEHSTYRTFVFQKRTEAPSGFVDGDLVESILDMDRSVAIEILQKVSDKGWDPSIPRDPVEILKIIEDLARMH